MPIILSDLTILTGRPLGVYNLMKIIALTLYFMCLILAPLCLIFENDCQSATFFAVYAILFLLQSGTLKTNGEK